MPHELPDFSEVSDFRPHAEQHRKDPGSLCHTIFGQPHPRHPYSSLALSLSVQGERLRGSARDFFSKFSLL